MITINQAYTYDPTRTLTLRKRFSGEMKRRFLSLKKDITSLIKTTKYDDLGDVLSFFTSEIAKLEYLTFEVTDVSGHWSKKFIDTSYSAGITRASAELKKIGAFAAESRGLSAVQRMALEGHARNLAILEAGVISSVKEAVAALNSSIITTMTDGALHNVSKSTIISQIRKKIDKSLVTRGLPIARTEIVRSFVTAAMREYEDSGVSDVEIAAECTTARDGHVCPSCASLDKKIFPISVIRAMLPLHPNCRCFPKPVLKRKKKDDNE